MTGEITLTLAFATGLFGALHCLGMCSGMAGGVFVRYGREAKGVRVLPLLTYHGSRVLVYAVLGSAGAAAGRVLVQTGLIGKGQGILMMTAGVFIVLVGLGLIGVFPPRAARSAEADPVRREVRFIGVRSARYRWPSLVVGALNGFVPCSLVFSMAVKGAASADPLHAGLLMTAFGLGTFPTMALVSLTGTVVGRRARGEFGRLAGLGVTVLGFWTLYEGLVFFDIMRGLGNW